MAKIIYAATPFRLEHLKEEICDFIQNQGHFPLHPFNTLPMSRYNYDNFIREDIMKVCYGMVDISDELWNFGIGSGSLDEITYAKKIKIPVKYFVKQFDPEWEWRSKKQKYFDKGYGDILKEII